MKLTREEVAILLGHAADLRRHSHGMPLVADLIERAVCEALKVPELEQRLADARGGPGGGMTE